MARWHESVRRRAGLARAHKLTLLVEETGRNILEKMDEQSCTGDFHYNKFLTLSVR